MVICLERGADLHMAQLMPLPLTVSCFSKIPDWFYHSGTGYPSSPGQRVVKRVCVLNWRSVPFSSSAVNPALCPIHTDPNKNCHVGVVSGGVNWTIVLNAFRLQIFRLRQS